MHSNICLLFLICILLYKVYGGSKRHELVVYWGQSSVYQMNTSPSVREKSLKYFCENSVYDKIVLAFLHIFFNGKNKDRMPTLNFAHHCYQSVRPDMPTLLKCPNIENAIKICQKNGKKVLMSLGGAIGPYGFNSETEAKQFANTVWNLLLNGTKLKDIRPFGDAILDGVDLDIENGPTGYYTTFVKELRTLMDDDKSKKYIIAAAPQCVYPDKYMGPGIGTPLGDIPQLFDELYIQFYNNFCQTGDRFQFEQNFETWLSYSKNNNGPMIYIGMPSHHRAAYLRGHWRTPSEVESIYKKYKKEDRLGGFMLWDASYDQNNIINGKPYSEHLVKMFDNKVWTTITTTLTKKKSSATSTITKSSTNTRPSIHTTSATSAVPTTQASPATTKRKRGILSCKGQTDGLHAHAGDCSKYFNCHSGRGTAIKCAVPGAKYNEKLKYCDHPWNHVDC